MACCYACSLQVLDDKVECSGICERIFHNKCLKRSSKVSPEGFFTCGDCADIRPCHVLRLVKELTISLASDQSLIADKVNRIAVTCGGLQVISDDVNAFSAKFDKLLDAANGLTLASSSLASRIEAVAGKLNNVSASIDDLCVNIATSSPASINSDSGHILPVMDNISRGIKQIKADFSSLQSVTSKDSEVISSIASDMKSLLLGRSKSDPAAKGSEPSVEPKQILSKRVSQRRGRRQPVKVAEPAKSPARDPLFHAVPAEVSLHAPMTMISKPISGPTECDNVDNSSLDAASSNKDNEPSRNLSSLSSRNATATGDSAALRPAVLPRCIFVSKLHPDTSPDQVVNHIACQFGASPNHVLCKRIDKPRNGFESFYASFKIIIPDSLYDAILSPEMWPNDTIVREFIPGRRLSSKSAPKNCSAKSTSTMPT